MRKLDVEEDVDDYQETPVYERSWVNLDDVEECHENQNEHQISLHIVDKLEILIDYGEPTLKV